MNDIRLKLIEKIKYLKNNDTKKTDVKQSLAEDSRLDDILHDIENLFSHHLFNGDIRINGKLICKHFFTTHSLLIAEGSGKLSKAKTKIQKVNTAKSGDSSEIIDKLITNDIAGKFKISKLGEYRKVINKFFSNNINIANIADENGEKIDDTYFNFNTKLTSENDIQRYFRTNSITYFSINSNEILGKIKLNNVNVTGKIPNINWSDIDIFKQSIFTNKFVSNQYTDNFENLDKISTIFITDQSNNSTLIQNKYPNPANDRLIQNLISNYNSENIYATTSELPKLLYDTLKTAGNLNNNSKSLLNGDPSGNHGTNFFTLSSDWAKLQEGYIVSDKRLKFQENSSYISLDKFKLKEYKYKKIINDDNKYIGLIADDISDKNFIELDEMNIKCNIQSIIYFDKNIKHVILDTLDNNLVNKDISTVYIKFEKYERIFNIIKRYSKSKFIIDYNFSDIDKKYGCYIISYKIKDVKKINLERLIMYYLHKLHKRCTDYENKKLSQLEIIRLLNKKKEKLKKDFFVLNKRIIKLENKLLDINNG